MPLLLLKKSCQSCNIAKLKCNGHRPQCARCTRRGIACEYAPSKQVGRPRRDSTRLRVAEGAQYSSSQGSILPALRSASYSAAAAPTPAGEASDSIEPPPERRPPTSHSASPLPPDWFIDGQEDTEACITSHALTFDDRIQFDLNATILHHHSDTSSVLSRDEMGVSDLSFLQAVTDNTFESMGSPFPSSYPSSTGDWACVEEQSQFILTSGPMEADASNGAVQPMTIDSSGRSNAISLSRCSCLTTLINLLLHRSKMRQVTALEYDGTLRQELEALMHAGLSTQLRCNRCLEDPLVSMIWARITNEYLTTVQNVKSG